MWKVVGVPQRGNVNRLFRVECRGVSVQLLPHKLQRQLALRVEARRQSDRWMHLALTEYLRYRWRVIDWLLNEHVMIGGDEVNGSSESAFFHYFKCIFLTSIRYLLTLAVYQFQLLLWLGVDWKRSWRLSEQGRWVLFLIDLHQFRKEDLVKFHITLGIIIPTKYPLLFFLLGLL